MEKEEDGPFHTENIYNNKNDETMLQFFCIKILVLS